MLLLPMNTPWGPSQTVREIAPGITSVSTGGHGGIKLSPARLAELLKIIPEPKSWAGLPWFEEDCDVLQVFLAFPKFFSDHSLSDALLMADRAEYIKMPMDTDTSTPHWQEIYRRVEAFRASVADKWEVGSMGTGGHGWNVHLSRGKESKWVPFAEYPKKSFYTDAELEMEPVLETAAAIGASSECQMELIS